MIAFLICVSITLFLYCVISMWMNVNQKNVVKSQEQYIISLENLIGSMQELCDSDKRMASCYEDLIDAYEKMNEINEEEIKRLNNLEIK